MRSWLVLPALASALVSALVLVFVFGLSACSLNDERAPLPGVRLGMSPRDVRDRFEGGEQGAWQTKLGGATDDTVLEWTATGASARATRARFEFHLGMLVAVRAHLRAPAPPAGRITATPKTVTGWSASTSEGGTELTMLARDCPTHHDEAELLASKVR
jgi:hypothetical protein